MKSLVPPSPRRIETLSRRLATWAGFRTLVASAAFAGTLWLRSGRSLGSGSGFTQNALGLLFAVTFSASAVFAYSIKRERFLKQNAFAQVLLDMGIAAALVYLTGGISSVFSFVFSVVILESAITMGERAPRRIAVAALIVYSALVLAIAAKWLSIPPDQAAAVYFPQNDDFLFAWLTNTVAIALVATLSSYLSSRLASADGDLAQAEASVARLTQLNDDIVRSLSAGLLTTDTAGLITSANPAACSYFRAGELELLGQPITHLLPSTLAGRGEGEATRFDGTSFPVGFTATELQGAVATSGRLVLFQDLTELRALREKAEHAERLAALGRLASGLAHEIRNPLGAMSGSVQLVRESPTLEEEDKTLLGIVQNEISRLGALVSTMLDLGRGKRAERTPVDLRALTDEIVSLVRNDSTLRKVRYVIEGHCEPVRADAGQLRQLLWNLLKNAAQVSPEGGVVCIRLKSEHGVAQLSVDDEGPGVPKSEREALFDMFYSKREHGIGLGLAVVKQITDAHRGSIEVGEAASGGASFRVRLPCERPDSTPPRATL